MHNTGKSGAQIHSARGFWVRLKLGGGQCWPHWSEVAYCELALDGVSAGFWSVGTHTTSSRTSVERRRAARARRSLFSRGEEDLPVRIAPTTTWLSQYTVRRLPAAWGEEARREATRSGRGRVGLGGGKKKRFALLASTMKRREPSSLDVVK